MVNQMSNSVRLTIVVQFTTALRAKEHEEKEARLSKLRPALRNMLKGNPNVFHYTTFPTADRLFSQHPIWQQAKIEAERRLIFEEYVAELKQREVVRAKMSSLIRTRKLMALDHFRQKPGLPGLVVCPRSWRYSRT